MGLKFRGGFFGPKNVPVATVVDNERVDESERQKQTEAENAASKEAASKELGGAVAGADSASATSADSDGKELQFGVQVAEATLQVWSKWHLIAAYAM
jgi:hypothetical protein